MKPHSPGSSHTSQTVPSRALSLVSLIAQYLNLGMSHSLVHGPVLKSVYTHPVCTPALPSLGPASSRCPSPWSWSYPSSYTAVIPWSIIISSTSSTLSAPPAPLSLSYFITLCKTSVQFTSVQFIHSVVSDSLRPHGLQHTRPPCLSPTPGAFSDSCPSSWWRHPNISSSLAPSPPAFNLSQHQGLFQRVSSLHQVAKVLEFSFSISPSNEYLGLISFRMDWLDLLAVQGTLKSLL